jgi:uncharacterized protein YkwD
MLAHALLLAASLGATPASISTPVAGDLHQIEQNLVHYTNLQRRRHGLPPLAIDKGLLQSARQHCSWMARSGSLTHTTAAVAENIAMGQSSSAHAVQDWMNSPGHRANMLNGSYRRMGATAYAGSGGRLFWCVQFLQ